MSGKNGAPAVDLVDVAMMSGEIVRVCGGTVFFTVSAPTERPTAPQLTACWSVDDLVEPITPPIAGAGIFVRSVDAPVQGDRLPALMYRLLWELGVRIREELGEDLEW